MQNQQVSDRQILAAIKASYGVISTISKELGLLRREAERRINESQLLLDEFNYQKEILADLAEKKLIEKIELGNLQAIKFYLERRHGKRGWSPTIDIDLDAKIASTTQVQLYIPDNQRDEIVEGENQIVSPTEASG